MAISLEQYRNGNWFVARYHIDLEEHADEPALHYFSPYHIFPRFVSPAFRQPKSRQLWEWFEVKP